MTFRAEPVASATPTPAGRLWPRPPLAQVKKLCGRSIGRWACMVARLEGDSSTRMLSGGRTSASVCIKYAIEMRSPGSTRGGAHRPRGAGLAGGAGRCNKAPVPSRTSQTMPRPAGVHAAISGTSIIWASSAPGGTCGPNPSMW